MNGSVFGLPTASTSFSCRSMLFCSLGVAVGDRVGHDRLRHDVRAGLDHHHRLAGAGHDEVEVALRELACWSGS